MTNRRSFVLGLFITASLLCTSRTAWGNSEINTYTKTDFAMDTVVSETLYTTGEDITADIISALKDVEENWISWTKESSQIYQINQNAGNTTTVSDETATCLKQVLDLSKASGGAMDPTMGRVIRLWDIDGENPHIPSDDELNSLLENVGYDKVTLDGNKVTMPKGVTLDLGAAGKGIGCDAAKKVLDADKNVSGMILNLGGSSVMSYGSKPDGSAWQVAVTDPRDTEGDYLGVVTLNGTEFLSTSGDYEKYFIEDGVRYHHILDPATGYPARSGLTSVTVVCDDGLNADGLSTACFVLGKEKAEELVETSRTSSYDFTQVEAYVNQHVAQQSSEMFRLIEAAEQKARDVSPEPIIPDTCKHNYDLDKVVREEFRNMPIGRDFIKVTYYYVCTKCGDTKTEVETYDA